MTPRACLATALLAALLGLATPAAAQVPELPGLPGGGGGSTTPTTTSPPPTTTTSTTPSAAPTSPAESPPSAAPDDLSLPALTGTAPAAYGGPEGRIALDRGWFARLDPRDQGLRRGWREGRFDAGSVRLPYVFNARTVTGRRGIVAHRGSVGWLRRTVTVPADGRYALRFESIHHRADVWLDGRRVAVHTGVYEPFEARLDLQAGRAYRLVVRADWRSPERLKQQGWHRTWFNFGGANREVSLRPLGRSELLAPNVRTRIVDGGRRALVTVAADVRNFAREPRSLGGQVTLSHQGRTYRLTLPQRIVAPNGRRTLRATRSIARPALWAPGSPALHDVRIVASDRESAYRLRTGLRELRWDGGRLRINGTPVTLRGASLHEDVPRRGDALVNADRDLLVATLAGIGANATRAQHPLDPALMERLDAAGILSWVGVGPIDAPGSWTSETPQEGRRARDRVRRSLEQLQTHPSLVAWNLVNEVAGNGRDATQRSYFRDSTRLLKARDPGRMVALDVWGPYVPEKPGSIYRDVDAIGVTNYVGWYEDPFLAPSRIERRVRERAKNLARTFAGKVLIISEFGAEGNDLNAARRPGGFTRQAALVRSHLDGYGDATGLDGWLVWNLRDFAVAPSFAGGSIVKLVPGIRLVRGINQKGLVTYGGEPKPAAAAARRAFLAETRAARARGAL